MYILKFHLNSNLMAKNLRYILSLANFTQAKPFFVTQSEVVSRGNITTERES